MRTSLSFLSLFLLAGCASQSERVVLLPSADGRASAVLVKSAQGERTLDKPYAASMREGGSDKPYQSSPEEVQQRFGPALAAQPPRARSFIVYFREGSDILVPESVARLQEVLAETKARSAPEVVVIGHTDRVGAVAANDALSLKRAAKVRDALIGIGLTAKSVSTAGRGEREPLVATEDEVAEAKNRRVEISIQ